ncbi:MAG: hypothetical protein CMA43_00680 [Euryarchaeota archaeon]|nr:hypothetical protein [Euryarchaeota archaeon]
MGINVSISIGELIDKITILEIKLEKINESDKKQNIKHELDLLNIEYIKIQELNKEIETYFKQLKEINLELWDIEESIRDCERRNNFDSEFVELSRKIYIKNDLRFEIKNKINKKFSSEIVEEKSYSKYQ